MAGDSISFTGDDLAAQTESTSVYTFTKQYPAALDPNAITFGPLFDAITNTPAGCGEAPHYAITFLIERINPAWAALATPWYLPLP